MPGFAERSTQSELMDTEPVGYEEFRACLKDLSLVNTLTLARRPTLAWLGRVTRSMHAGDQLSVLDVGFGYGDMLRAIHGWCLDRGFVPDLSGIDLNPGSAASATAATPSDVKIAYHTGDVFGFRPERPVDIVVCSQFTHHLTDEQIVSFIRWMEGTAGRGWFVSDLHRHPVPFHVFRVMSRVARRHRFIQNDGPISIARSFRRADWRRLTRAAGLDPAAVKISWHVPFRICVGRAK
jgi:SAM-dependent methyltransferase